MNEAMPRSWVWVDGRVLDGSTPVVTAGDRALSVGHGVFETMRLVRGVPFALGRHLRRLRRSATIARVALAWGDSEFRSAVDLLVATAPAPPPGHTAKLRIQVSAGAASPLLTLDFVPEPARTATAVTIDRPVDPNDPLRAAKSTSRLAETLALADAQGLGADEALRLTTDGRLCEGATTNVFLAVDGHLATPATSTGCLAGVTRELVMELVDVVERDDLTAADLNCAGEVFLTSSLRGVQPVAVLDGRQLGTPGPLTVRAAEAFAALATTDLDP